MCNQKEDEIISTKKKYRSVLLDLWKFMPTQRILQTSTFNFKMTNENGKNGYKWCDDIKMSFQPILISSKEHGILKLDQENIN